MSANKNEAFAGNGTTLADQASTATGSRFVKCLGIDIGSSTIKGAVLNLEAGTLEQATARPFPPPMTNLPRRHFEVDPTAVLLGVREVLQALTASETELSAILFTGQMGGVVLVDDFGVARSPYYSWRDERAVVASTNEPSLLDSIRVRLGDRRWAELGNELKPGSPLCLLAWLRENERLPKEVTAASLGGYVLANLTGEKVVAEPTEAIGTLDVTRADWHWEAVEQLGLGGVRWPALGSYREPCGELMIGRRRVPVHRCVGDHQCSLVGVGLKERELSINISTGSQVSLLTETVALGDWQTRLFFDGSYLNTVTHLPAGRSLSVLVDLFGTLGKVKVDEAWREILQAADEAPESELEVDLAFFDGPMGNRGAIRGITLDNLTVGGVFRAAFRNMAENYGRCADRLSRAGVWDQVVLSGGLAQKSSCLWRFLAERFAEPLRSCPEGEDSLLGLLNLARRAYGGEKGAA